jgi:uncharacterized protein (TIGR03118 family)
MKSRQRLFGNVVVLAGAILPVAKGWAGVTVTNLVTDNQSVNSALITDPNLINPWGMSYSGTSPFWVSDNGTHLATLYNVNPITNVPATVSLDVSIPANGNVTGQAFNGTTGFNSDSFLFVSEDGTVSGWRSALGTTAEILQSGSAANAYTGAALATISGNAYLYTANFKVGTIDVIKGSASEPTLPGTFTDPNLPAGYAPFNVENLGGTLYVTYALQNTAGDFAVPGAGNGFVDSFDLNGNFLERDASNGSLNAPWGVAIAPAGFDGVGGDLLVGNFGDGTINAFNTTTFASEGPLKDSMGNPITIDGLWSLTVGNGASAGSSSQIYFTAGSNGEADGLFGTLSVPEPSSIAAVLVGAGALARRRQRTV